ncbi:MAG: DUF2867 domain-containing protein [Mycobacteriaceae bacterium]|nr:DUF2867 domain-containing protein [Mycobacteriaceae bacterium]
MAIAKVERLMNLVIALLSTRGYLTAERIRATVYGYGDCASDEAFSRMFERDKNELRDLGIPLETGRVRSFDAVDGYRIKPDKYSLPDIDLTPEEAAAVAVATKLWESPELITATQNALLKLRAANRGPGDRWLEMRVTPDGVGSRYEQRAIFYPRGLLGRLYWFAGRPLQAMALDRRVRRVTSTVA